MGSTGIFKLGGDKKLDMDLKSFKPKLFYDNASEDELKLHVLEIQKRQKQLEKYKYHQDLDRIDNSNPVEQWISLENFIDRGIIGFFILSILFNRMNALQYYKEYYCTRAYWTFLPTTAIFVGFGLVYMTVTSDYFRPQNRQYYKTISTPTRNFINLDYNLNLYKYVDEVKHQYKYPTVKQFKQIKKRVDNARTVNQEKGAVKFFKQKYTKKQDNVI